MICLITNIIVYEIARIEFQNKLKSARTHQEEKSAKKRSEPILHLLPNYWFASTPIIENSGPDVITTPLNFLSLELKLIEQAIVRGMAVAAE